MRIRPSIAAACVVATALLLPAAGAGLSAMPIIVTENASFALAPISFSFDGATFTFSATGDAFSAPVAIQTSSNAAVRSFGGFAGIPVSPSTDFPDRGSGVLTYGPGTSFASFTTATPIPYSNGDNYLGLRAILDGVSYYGYAFTTDTTLNSFGFETTPNTAFTLNTSTAAAVPEPATWAMMVGGFGLIGAAMRRKKPVLQPS